MNRFKDLWKSGKGGEGGGEGRGVQGGREEGKGRGHQARVQSSSSGSWSWWDCEGRRPSWSNQSLFIKDRAIWGGFGVDKGVLMSKEPGFLKEEGEVLFEVSRGFKGEVVEIKGMSFTIKTARDFSERGKGGSESEGGVEGGNKGMLWWGWGGRGERGRWAAKSRFK